MMPDLSTTYLKLPLRNPLVVSASPLCESVENIRRMEEAGAGAIVLHSLFEEQITLETHSLDYTLSQGAESFPEALSYFPEPMEAPIGPKGYLTHLRRAKKAVRIPVIASLNGTTPGGWVQYAKRLEDAGADAIELNVYYIPADPEIRAVDVEQRYIQLVHDVKQAVHIPLAVKVGPFFTAPANMASELRTAGADGLVLFNRFYQPDIDLEHLEVVPNLLLSCPTELRLRLRWIALLSSRLDIDLAVTGGVHSASDVLKCMMAGAHVAMMTTALLRHGIDYLGVVRRDIDQWMIDHEYESISQMRGSMDQSNVDDPAAFERANYLKVLSSYTTAG